MLFLPAEELPEEFRCPCCGAGRMDRRLVEGLEKLRALAGTSIEIVSGFRCPSYGNRAMGPSRKAHLEGRAADIRIPGRTVDQMYELANKISDFRYGGIGWNDDGTLHVDVRVFKARWRRVDGRYLGMERS